MSEVSPMPQECCGRKKSLRNKFSLLKIKKSGNKEIFYLFGLLPVYRRPVLYADDNTFVVWEPCSGSHGEVLPGFVHYLLDMGYTVSVVLHKGHHKDGLFSRLQNDKLFLNHLSRRQAKKYFKNADLSHLAGIMVTTMGKLCQDSDIVAARENFSATIPRKKLFFVEHDAKIAIDENRWDETIITLRRLNYKNAGSVMVNPHRFGDVAITPKNQGITRFVTVGAINPKRKNSAAIVNAVKTLVDKGITNFRVTVIGKGRMDDVPENIRPFLEIKGRLPFGKMYEELEKADFMLTAYDPENELHQRYNTVGTSGNFQLVYGFAKPCIIVKDFAEVNGFTEENSIIYPDAASYAGAMEYAVNMSSGTYELMQADLKKYAGELYEKSLNNLRRIVQ